jgi:glutamyl/glutaminyl-tRNA synthetase
MEYKKMGFLPEAVVNYIAHLGWSSGTNQELFSIDELIKEFTLDKVSKHSAIFDMEKLNWFNGEYLKDMPEDKYAEMLLPYLQESGLIDYSVSVETFLWLKKVVSLMKSRVRNFRQFLEYADYFFTDDFKVEEDAARVLEQNGVRETLVELAGRLEALNEWSEENIEKVVRAIANELNLKGKQIIHPTRVSLSGKKVGPSLFALMEVLGKEINIRRLKRTAVELG